MEARLAAAESRNRLNNRVAVAVALISAFMAVTKIKDDNIVQAMLQAKSDAVDTWNEYQAKKLKLHLSELGLNQARALRLAVPPQGAAALAEQENGYAATIARYQAESETIMKKAKGFEKQYDDLNFRDDQFDLSDALLSISLAILAVTALTANLWLFRFSLVFAGFGGVMGMAGLMGLSLHPDWLTKLLS
ncbi:hypothetical protein GPICK_13620 [Geobacter pickeringii]|uniref:DUF4337 domain-containing protein n=2 Tax=Geobacter pickeringii TaxID=345632 RepID=A0A0B5BDZ5_9BACT|nr:hypothetical protein GPICK_13620 [Geobacter pickeringii]